jgi:hypothetical protein
MGQEPRKATDVLLDLESKVNTLLDIVRSQDLNIKILSNKLNDVMGRLEKRQASPPKFVVEAVQKPVVAPPMPPGFRQLPAGDPERTIPIVAESKLPQTGTPDGFRRTSRPETFAGDGSYLPRAEVKMPVQMPPQMRQDPNAPPPGRSAGEVLVPPEASNNKKKVAAPVQQQPQMTEQQPMPESAQGQIPVMQRVVDKHSKSIFLADVEITDLSTSQPIFKTRTNGTGKWMASLGIGAYRVVISKRAAMNKEKLEAVQDIQIDGSQSPLELPMLIVKG